MSEGNSDRIVSLAKRLKRKNLHFAEFAFRTFFVFVPDEALL